MKDKTQGSPETRIYISPTYPPLATAVNFLANKNFTYYPALVLSYTNNIKKFVDLVGKILILRFIEKKNVESLYPLKETFALEFYYF